MPQMMAQLGMTRPLRRHWMSAYQPSNACEQRFVQVGLDGALARKPTTRRSQRKLDGVGEAQLVAITCSPPPEGADRWTLALLVDKLVELKVVDAIARDTVRLTLKKTNSSRG